MTGKGEKLYSLCREADESSFHLFKDCAFTRAVAFGSCWGIKMEG